MQKSNHGFINVGIIIFILILVTTGFLGFYFLSNQNSQPETISETPSSTTQTQTESLQYAFSNPKKSAHYESNTPEHASVIPAVPINVVIDFNFDLADNSTISITKDGKEYGVRNVVIDSNKLTMRRNIDPNAPDGLYTVNYNACWPDRTCHDGNFQFAIDRSLKSNYQDMTGQNQITINMSNLEFSPMNIIISRGTTVIWVNNDNEAHFVNTDPHPAHTYNPEQNSRSLEKGESYSYTFAQAGYFPYHCSAHTHMTGSIIVE